LAEDHRIRHEGGVLDQQCFVFVPNRETGKPAWPIVERPVVRSQIGIGTLKSERADPTAYGAAIKEMNGLLNGKSSLSAEALGVLGRTFTSDGPYGKTLVGVRKSLGHDIKFCKAEGSRSNCVLPANRNRVGSARLIRAGDRWGVMRRHPGTSFASRGRLIVTHSVVDAQ
jgi:hypothetical protein